MSPQKTREIVANQLRYLGKRHYSQLMKLAQGDRGGSRVAAQVLLSAYNGGAWQLNIVDLCVLDKSNYKAALGMKDGSF